MKTIKQLEEQIKEIKKTISRLYIWIFVFAILILINAYQIYVNGDLDSRTIQILSDVVNNQGEIVKLMGELFK